MDKNLKAETVTNNSDIKVNLVSQITSDNLVNDFIDKKISLEFLIEKEIYN